MSGNQFFVVLPSDSSMDIFPENKTSSYKVNFPNGIAVDPEKWEVALQEIQFPHHWYNIRRGHNVIYKEYLNPTVKELNTFFPIPNEKDPVKETEKRKEVLERKPENVSLKFKREIEVPPGQYHDVNQILTFLREFEVDDTRPAIYSVNQISKRVSIQLADGCNLHFNNSDIAKCLGFKPKSTLTDFNVFIPSDSMMNTTRTYDHVYVYSDIIENQHVGDYKVPLLRIVPITSKFGEINWIHYDRPHFLRLSRENINIIEVNIRDDMGELISFESGKVLVTLVFRRITAKFYP